MRFFFLEETTCFFILSIINLALNSAILLCSGRFIFMFIEKSHLLLPSILCTQCLYDLSSFRSCVILFLITEKSYVFSVIKESTLALSSLARHKENKNFNFLFSTFLIFMKVKICNKKRTTITN